MIQTWQENAWASVTPLGERAFLWPPKGGQAGHHFVAFVVQPSERMRPDQACVRENFPDEGCMTAVFPLPNGIVGYHIGKYGTFWPTDEGARKLGEQGGFLEDGKGGLDQVHLGVNLV